MKTDRKKQCKKVRICDVQARVKILVANPSVLTLVIICDVKSSRAFLRQANFLTCAVVTDVQEESGTNTCSSLFSSCVILEYHRHTLYLPHVCRTVRFAQASAAVCAPKIRRLNALQFNAIIKAKKQSVLKVAHYLLMLQLR